MMESVNYNSHRTHDKLLLNFSFKFHSQKKRFSIYLQFHFYSPNYYALKCENLRFIKIVLLILDFYFFNRNTLH